MKNEISLSILTATIVERNESFNRIYNELKKQCEPYKEQIEILVLSDNRELSIGEKRNILSQNSKGKYIVYWDDDDWICENGIELIMNGINKNVDCITYKILNVSETETWETDFSIKYKRTGWIKDDEKIKCVSNPNYRMVIKKEIMSKIPIDTERMIGDDGGHMFKVQKHLKSEYHIDEWVYQYNISHNSSYNLNRFLGKDYKKTIF